VRALIGGAASGVWRDPLSMSVTVAAAACLGKMLGGIVGDRAGWTRTTVTALCIAAPLVSLAVHSPTGAVVGVLIFQTTMPVTLKATHHLMPARPALAFGTACLALFVGALPAFAGLHLLPTAWHTMAFVIGSAALLGVGLPLAARAGTTPDDQVSAA
jgi:FSR family fosmidomycin resistance protein-like MFS transporter